MVTTTQSEPGAQRWYRMTIVWLGAIIFAASLAGCIAVIVLATQFADEPLPFKGERVFRVPNVPSNQELRE